MACDDGCVMMRGGGDGEGGRCVHVMCVHVMCVHVMCVHVICVHVTRGQDDVYLMYDVACVEEV